ncbi:MAG: amidohydrolase family protein, partial [Blastocatellia bacterium]
FDLLGDFDNPENIAQHVEMYLKDGVFYVKVLTDVRSRALKIADKVNQPTSIDVSYSHGGLSASNGHPLATYEGLALYRRPGGFDAEQTQKVRESRLRDNDAYYIIDTAADLESKWPKILEGKPDFIKVYLLYSEEYETRKNRADTVGDRALNPELVPLIVRKAHAAGLRVSAHVTTAFDYRVALKAGVDEMAHLPGHYIPPAADPQKFQLTEEDVKETARRGVWVVPAPAYYEAFNPQSATFNAQIKERTEAVGIHNLKLLRQHKVKIAFGSDSYGRTPIKDVLYLKTLGVFSNLEMLKIWCEDTPRTIFPNRKLGLLAEGYEASFLVLDGDPLVDFEQIKNIRTRFKQGYFLMEK